MFLGLRWWECPVELRSISVGTRWDTQPGKPVPSIVLMALGTLIPPPDPLCPPAGGVSADASGGGPDHQEYQRPQVVVVDGSWGHQMPKVDTAQEDVDGGLDVRPQASLGLGPAEDRAQ